MRQASFVISIELSPAFGGTNKSPVSSFVASTLKAVFLYKQKLPVFISLLKTPIIGRTSLALLPPKRVVKYILKSAYYNDNKITQKDIEAYAAPMMSQGSHHALIQTAKQLVHSDIDSITSLYKVIDIPVLILWGRQDLIVPLQIRERLHQDIPHSQLVIIEKAGHNPHEEEPEETVQQIVRFLLYHSDFQNKDHNWSQDVP